MTVDAQRARLGLPTGADADISPDWRGSTRQERRVLAELVKLDKSPKAIVRFARDSDSLGDYWYWFTLGTLWVNYSGQSDIALWRRLFTAERPNRATSLMKPSELSWYERLPSHVRAYRAHRPDETDWIAYTVDEDVACRFARERKVDQVVEYAIAKADVLALFTRRGEQELLVLDPRRARRLGAIEIMENWG